MFRDRTDAGRKLGAALSRYAGRDDLVVLALPRGGVPVGFEVARLLQAPLDVFLVRKLGVPGQEELAMGAIASGDIRVLNHSVLGHLGIPPSVLERVAEKETLELRRRECLYRGTRPFPGLADKTVILVDDGLATGSSMRAAVAAVRHRAVRTVVAVPVAPESTCRELGQEADEVVCLSMPEPFDGVGRWYGDFSQTTDAEVRAALERAQR